MNNLTDHDSKGSPRARGHVGRILTRRRATMLAALTTGTCLQFGAGCVQSVLAIIGATFF